MFHIFCDCFRLPGSSNCQFIGQAFKGSLPVGPGESAEPLPDPGEPVDGAGDEVQCQDADEESEPDRVIDIEQIKKEEYLQGARAKIPRERHGSLLLGNKGAHNGYQCKDDQEYNGQAHGAEKAPYWILCSRVFGCSHELIPFKKRVSGLRQFTI